MRKPPVKRRGLFFVRGFVHDLVHDLVHGFVQVWTYLSTRILDKI